MIVQSEVDAVSGASEMRCRFGVVDVNRFATARAGQHSMPPFGVIEHAGLSRRSDNTAHGERDASPGVSIHSFEPGVSSS